MQWAAARDGVTLTVRYRSEEPTGPRLDVEARADCADGALDRMFSAIRHVSSREELAQHGVNIGFRVEDVVSVVAGLPAIDHSASRDWLARRLSRQAALTFEPAADGQVGMAVTFAPRGVLPTSQRRRYEQEGDRVRVEAFELHVVEHCNLRCAHCCNMSPYLEERTLSVAEVETLCTTMAQNLAVDVFKIMGGEPLLHPDITGVLRAIRRSGISDTVRLFTNGVLLHTVGDDFWEALDELTISNYSTAPVKPKNLELARAKAHDFDVVLNVKPVSEFSEVMRADRVDDDAAVQRTYETCWLRHRCMVVRGGKFYTCTRAAYAEDFHRTLLHDAYPQDRDQALANDGVSLDTPDLAGAILAYLNRGRPLASCRFCHGGAGPVDDHAQLTKSDVRAGRLRPLPVLS